MSIEDLMKPRYKVIADWPGNTFDVGQILVESGIVEDWLQTDNFLHGFKLSGVKQYPHLFKPLTWWEERSMVDIPMFIRFGEYDNPPYAIYQIISWNLFDKDIVERYSPCGYAERPHEYFISLRFPHNYPATESEYNDYLNQSK